MDSLCGNSSLLQTVGSAREQETLLNVYSCSFTISSACSEFPPPTAEMKGKETFMGNQTKLAALSDENQNYLPP